MPDPAAARWAAALAAWALPERILAAAPQSPWGFRPDLFTAAARDALAGPPTPTHLRVAEALPPGWVLLDVGSGAGAASLPVRPTPGCVVAVDEDPAMLAAVGELAAGRIAVRTVPGRWPAVAAVVGTADVAVCANVAYNVPDLGEFVAALTAAARHRVVLELSERHPQSGLSPLWRRFWDLDRPDRPTAADAADVVREVTGAEVAQQRWTRPRPVLPADPADVSWLRRRLCLPPARDPEIAAAVAELGPAAPTEFVTMWWPGTATG